LRTNVTAEDRKQLEAFLATLPEVDESVKNLE
jgi:hypothetical protein